MRGQPLDALPQLCLGQRSGHGGAVGYPAVPTRTASSARSWRASCPSERVDEDEHTVAFMDINPWTRGHALVIPRNHSRNLYEIDDDGPGQHGGGRQAPGRSGCATSWAPTA